MNEETTQSVNEQDAQTTTPAGDVDYEALYHKEKKYSQSLRSRAQEAEGKNEKLSLASEEARQSKLIAEGKKDDLIAELSEKNKAMESRLTAIDKAEAKKKATYLESIPEDERPLYENMNIEQLEHFVNKQNKSEVSNPTEVVQGRNAKTYTLDDFNKLPRKDKQSNYTDLLKQYEKSSTTKVKANKYGNTIRNYF